MESYYIIFLTILFIAVIYSYHVKKNQKPIKAEVDIPIRSDIPKVLHLIWIGNKKQPENIKSWINNFQQNNKDWLVKVWGNEDIKALGLVNQKQYDKIKQYCGKADIARYEILYRYGGMYLDADTLWLENKVNPDFFRKSLNLTNEENGLVMNGWFTCVKNHPFLKLVIDEIPKRDIENLSAWKSVGPKLLTDIYKRIDNKDYYDIHFVDLKTVLCPTVWHGITADKYKPLLDKCKKEKKALAFHWGLSTNN